MPFGAIRSGFRAAEKFLGRKTMGLLNRGAMNRAMVPSAAASTMGWLSRRGDYALSSMGGAVLGGTYGAFSDDTSVLGGALWGAGLGAGGLFTARFGRNMYDYYKPTRLLSNRAVNPIPAMQRGPGGVRI